MGDGRVRHKERVKERWKMGESSTKRKEKERWEMEKSGMKRKEEERWKLEESVPKRKVGDGIVSQEYKRGGKV